MVGWGGVGFGSRALFSIWNRLPTRRFPADHIVAARPGGLASRIDAQAPGVVLLLGARRIRVDLGASMDARVRMLAELQCGCVARWQLLLAGIAPSALDRRLRNGFLERVHTGVYRLRGTSEIPLAAESAALLACGDRAVLSHHSAATLWQLRPGTARPVHITIPGHRGCPSPDGVTVHRSLTVIKADVRLHHGLPLTSPARTLLDVSANLPDRDLERLLDEGIFVRRIVTRTQIGEVLARAGGHPGRSRLARVAGRHTRCTKTDSPPEEMLLALIRRAGLPEPRTQVPMLGYAIDFFWPELQLAVEIDTYGTHGSPMRFESDRRRDARLLTEKGIAVIRITRAAVEERATEALALVARAIGQREAR